jgi:hypothetical protein
MVMYKFLHLVGGTDIRLRALSALSQAKAASRVAKKSNNKWESRAAIEMPLLSFASFSPFRLFFLTFVVKLQLCERILPAFSSRSRTAREKDRGKELRRRRREEPIE